MEIQPAGQTDVHVLVSSATVQLQNMFPVTPVMCALLIGVQSRCLRFTDIGFCS